MMSDVDKPFACSQPGCGMKFTNEDHLDVHKQKHTMSLALNSTCMNTELSGVLFADQTPTPTKFLKNCDDIGLFQELNKNPFEESFKKAASDLTKEQSVDTPTIPHRGDDIRSVMDSPLPGPQLLRTPSITVTDTSVSSEAETLLQPTVTSAVKSTKRVVGPSPLAVTTTVEATVARTTITTTSSKSPLSRAGVQSSFTDTITQSQVGPATTPQHSPVTTAPLQPRVVHMTPEMSVQVLLTLPGGTSVQLPASAVFSPTAGSPVRSVSGMLPSPGMSILSAPPQPVQQVPLNLKTNTVTKAAASSSTSALTKQKLKAALCQNSMLKESAKSPTEGSLTVTPGQSDSEPSTPDNTVDTTTIGSKRRLTSDSEYDETDPDLKRLRFLARNRAAAQRCRDKRKNWISSLEGKAEELTNQNTSLQNEVKSLREEVAELKMILLEHKDCPITLEQQARGVLPGNLVFNSPLSPTGDMVVIDGSSSTMPQLGRLRGATVHTAVPLARLVSGTGASEVPVARLLSSATTTTTQTEKPLQVLTIKNPPLKKK